MNTTVRHLSLLFVYEYVCAMNVAFQTTKYHAYYSSLKYGNEYADLIIHTDKLWNYHSSTFALQYDHISSSSHFGHQWVLATILCNASSQFSS